MALANVAWILATNGLRVLVIDWDLEAPGLHRYFHPFLADKELSESPGLIDFFCDFHTEAHLPGNEKNWHLRYTDFIGYSQSLEWDFGDDAGIDFVPAGQQGPAYSVRASSFDWREFYSKLGGGVLLEALKRQLREDYDYILIDSRTGITDVSGLCTVHMPDDLVVCYTLNRQSMQGAAAAARSAFEQRRKPSGEPSLRVWPLATRIELAEKDRLESARSTARTLFQPFLMHLERSARDRYWGQAELLYQPYYAYEEILAVFADRKHQTNSLLTSFDLITSLITDGAVRELGSIPEELRLATKKQFLETPVHVPAQQASLRNAVYIVERSASASFVDRISACISEWFGEDVVFTPLPGDDWEQVCHEAIHNALVVILAVNMPSDRDRSLYPEELLALKLNKRIIPVLDGEMELPAVIAKLVAIDFSTASGSKRLREGLIRTLSIDVTPKPQVDPDDPQKGQWGMEPSRNGRNLTARVSEIGAGWFRTDLAVSDSSRPLTDPVTFHLHPTFIDSTITVHPENGLAKLSLNCWGAFTVGAVTDDGRTQLELDLATISEAPQVFRER
ncbi:MAG: hypothetical protein H7039_03915 [Bryobacteraceae bacterium]|nr:hypothetical protein [Bryobacteraceae bacterium]